MSIAFGQVKFSLVLVLLPLLAVAQKFENLALKPPMGWNSWNRFQCEGLNEQVVRETADALLRTGMREAGYEYIVLDDCWQIGRDSAGTIVADPQKFPSGIKALADYLHGIGFKFGLYSCAGTMTCAKRPGSRGYEFADARQYAAWGVDYVKYDWCHTSTQDAKESYTLMSEAIRKAGRPMVFSLCEWGLSKPWNWAKPVGHLWRTTGDIQNSWNTPDAKEGKVWGGGVIINLDMQQGLEGYAGPGHWNDPDMLEVGNGVLTPNENQAHFSLWCMLAAPLMAGNDIRHMDQATLRILTNREAIAIDQDPLGKQGYKLKDYGEQEVYVKPLANGDTAICFFNRSSLPWKLRADWAELGFRENLFLRDVWAHKNLGTTAKPLTATLPEHAVLLLRLSKQEMK
jgi:alpha-galactosidase